MCSNTTPPPKANADLTLDSPFCQDRPEETAPPQSQQKGGDQSYTQSYALYCEAMRQCIREPQWRHQLSQLGWESAQVCSHMQLAHSETQKYAVLLSHMQ